MDDKKLKKIREKRNRERQAKLEYGVAVGAAICFLIICIAVFAKWTKAVRERKLMEEEREREAREEALLSDSVLEYKDLMHYYAAEEGIEEHVPVLLAIMEAETKGERADVMQSSESLGLEPNSLGPEESIEQACSYYSKLLDIADDLGCDEKSVIQAYNYGPGYLYYVSDHGGKHTFDLAVDYAEEMSGGRTSGYYHDIADFNGNWMYLYGNMYYVMLVEQYLPD